MPLGPDQLLQPRHVDKHVVIPAGILRHQQHVVLIHRHLLPHRRVDRARASLALHHQLLIVLVRLVRLHVLVVRQALSLRRLHNLLHDLLHRNRNRSRNTHRSLLDAHYTLHTPATPNDAAAHHDTPEERTTPWRTLRDAAPSSERSTDPRTTLPMKPPLHTHSLQSPGDGRDAPVAPSSSSPPPGSPTACSAGRLAPSPSSPRSSTGCAPRSSSPGTAAAAGTAATHSAREPTAATAGPARRSAGCAWSRRERGRRAPSRTRSGDATGTTGGRTIMGTHTQTLPVDTPGRCTSRTGPCSPCTPRT